MARRVSKPASPAFCARATHIGVFGVFFSTSSLHAWFFPLHRRSTWFAGVIGTAHRDGTYEVAWGRGNFALKGFTS